LNSTQGGFLWARMDTLNAVNYGLAVLGQRVRSARNIGELYGDSTPITGPVVRPLPPGPQQHPEAVDPTQLPNQSIQAGTVTLVSDSFPSVGDPLYGPQGSITVANWPWNGGVHSPYKLSATTLVLQVPAFDNNGFPQSLPPAYIGAPPLSALDTYVYNLVPDPDPKKSGLYQLQLAYFPAPNGLTNVPSGITPGTVTTIISGIVGPRDGNGNLSIFQYVQKLTNSAVSTVNPIELQNYAGVIVNLEVINKDNRGRYSILPVRSEMYMRNNVAATTIGSPPAN
jgi:hypothetical protein